MIYWTPEEQARLIEIITKDPNIFVRTLMEHFPGRSSKAIHKRAKPLREEIRARGLPPVPPVPPVSLSAKRNCLRCRRLFVPFDRKKNWVCGECK